MAEGRDKTMKINRGNYTPPIGDNFVCVAEARNLFDCLHANTNRIQSCQLKYSAYETCLEKSWAMDEAVASKTEEDDPAKQTALRRLLVTTFPRFFNVDEVPREESALKGALAAAIPKVFHDSDDEEEDKDK